MTHEGAKHLNIIDPIIADVISPGSDEYEKLNAKDRENMSCLFLEVGISLFVYIASFLSSSIPTLMSLSVMDWTLVASYAVILLDRILFSSNNFPY